MNLSAITLFDKTFDPLSMKNSSEAAKFEPEPTFENIINEIRNIYLKIIASDNTNPSAITSIDKNFDPLCMNNRLKTAKFEP